MLLVWRCGGICMFNCGRIIVAFNMCLPLSSLVSRITCTPIEELEESHGKGEVPITSSLYAKASILLAK